MQEIVLHFFFAYTTTTLHGSHVLSASLGGDWGPLKTLKEALPRYQVSTVVPWQT